MIICLSGFCGAGKDHLANLLVNGGDVSEFQGASELQELMRSRNFQRVALADSLKRMYEERYGPFDKHGMNETLNISHRQAIQNMADEIKRHDPHAFVRCIPDGDVLVTDLRFKEELDYLRDKPFKVYWIRRVGLDTPRNCADERCVAEITPESVGVDRWRVITNTKA